VPFGSLTNTTSWISPSGDPTGATDIALINSLLTTQGAVELRGLGFNINSPIVQPSFTTLLLRNAQVNLVAGSNCNVWQNASQTVVGDQQVHVRGIGRASFNGNAYNQARQTSGYTFINNMGFNAVQINGFSIQDIQIGPTNAWGMFLQGCSFGRIKGIHFEQDRSTTYQDGIDIGLGCHDIAISDLTGQTGDDISAVQAYQYPAPAYVGLLPLAPIYQPGASPSLPLNVANITWRNINVNGPFCIIRVFNDNTCTVKNLAGSGLRNTNTSQSGSLFAIGSSVLIANSSHYPAAGVNEGFTFEDLSCAGGIASGYGAVALDSHMDDLRVSGIDVGFGAFNTQLIGTPANNYSPTVTNVAIDHLKARASAAGTVSDLVNFRTGSIVTQFTLKDVELVAAQHLLNNAGTVTGLHVRGIHVGTCFSPPFNSAIAETGDIDDVTVDALSGTTVTYSEAMALKMGMHMPQFQSTDTTPAATAGSFAQAASGKVLDAGAATAAVYAAGGSAWTRMASVS
jgi:hypothetical protein